MNSSGKQFTRSVFNLNDPQQFIVDFLLSTYNRIKYSVYYYNAKYRP